eukprot:Clim_evm57s149 gene=Clim_evmTU57s149
MTSNGTEQPKDSGQKAESSSSRKRRSVKNREQHNRLEKYRRAHLKACFEELKETIPSIQDSKASTVAILQHATKYTGALNQHYEQTIIRIAKLRYINEWCKQQMAEIEGK